VYQSHFHSTFNAHHLSVSIIRQSSFLNTVNWRHHPSYIRPPWSLHAQRGSGTARMPFLAAKAEPTSHGRRGVDKGKRHALPNRLRPVWTRTFQRLPAPWPTSAQGTVDGVLGTPHYTAAIGMVFTQGLDNLKCPRPVDV